MLRAVCGPGVSTGTGNGNANADVGRPTVLDRRTDPRHMSSVMQSTGSSRLTVVHTTEAAEVLNALYTPKPAPSLAPLRDDVVNQVLTRVEYADIAGYQSGPDRDARPKTTQMISAVQLTEGMRALSMADPITSNIMAYAKQQKHTSQLGTRGAETRFPILIGVGRAVSHSAVGPAGGGGGGASIMFAPLDEEISASPAKSTVDGAAAALAPPIPHLSASGRAGASAADGPSCPLTDEQAERAVRKVSGEVFMCLCKAIVTWLRQRGVKLLCWQDVDTADAAEAAGGRFQRDWQAHADFLQDEQLRPHLTRAAVEFFSGLAHSIHLGEKAQQLLLKYAKLGKLPAFEDKIREMWFDNPAEIMEGDADVESLPSDFGARVYVTALLLWCWC